MCIRDRGKPLVSKPQGILMAGSPAKFTGTVNRSDKYIESGSLVKSPFRKAVVGQVGVLLSARTRYLLDNLMEC